MTLGPGHFWRLGVQLDAQRIGSPLRGALSLFDSNGNVLATVMPAREGPTFRPIPIFFSGLNPGVYYIGVSGAGNLRRAAGRLRPRGRHHRHVGEPAGRRQIRPGPCRGPGRHSDPRSWRRAPVGRSARDESDRAGLGLLRTDRRQQPAQRRAATTRPCGQSTSRVTPGF